VAGAGEGVRETREEVEVDILTGMKNKTAAMQDIF
jgi:hypothetical protein